MSRNRKGCKRKSNVQQRNNPPGCLMPKVPNYEQFHCNSYKPFSCSDWQPTAHPDPVEQFHQLQKDAACCQEKRKRFDYETSPRYLPCECNCPAYGYELGIESMNPSKPTNLLRRYMEKQMEFGGLMNSLYGINFYSIPKYYCVQPKVDAESELIQLRLLLQPNTMTTASQQQKISGHIERLLELSPMQLTNALENGFLSGILDAGQLLLIQQWMPLHRLCNEMRIPLMNFFRRLKSDLPYTRYRLDLEQHIELLRHNLVLRDACPKPQARRLLNTTVQYMSNMPDTELIHFLEQFNPAQLQQLMNYIKISSVHVPPRRLQRLLRVTKCVLKCIRKMELNSCDIGQLQQLLTTPVDEPLTMQQRRFLQTLLDHLLPMSKSEQLQCLSKMPLNLSRVRRLRLMLHNPALLYNAHQLKQLYEVLQQLTQMFINSN